jgi:hypothetical protein
LQYKVNRFEEQSDRREHLALGGVRQHALFDAILCAEIGVEVDFGFVEELEVRADDDSYVMLFIAVLGAWWGSCDGGAYP